MRKLDYYKCLQVDENAEQDIIEMAYRKLSQKYHPDINDAQNAHDRMCIINEAYQTLSRPALRENYDRMLKTFGQVEDVINANKTQVFVQNKKAISWAYQQLDAYLESIRTKNYSIAYTQIHPMHKETLSLRVFKNWQHWVAKVYALNAFQIVFKAIDFHVRIEGIYYDQVITFEVIVKEFNQIMEQHENDKFSKCMIIHDGTCGVLLDQLEVFEVMHRFEKLAKLKQGRRYRARKWRPNAFYHEIDLEVERYSRYRVPFTLIFFKLDSARLEDLARIADHFNTVLEGNMRRLDKKIQIKQDIFLVMLPGNALTEGKLFAEKIDEIMETSELLSPFAFMLKRVIIENEHTNLEDVLSAIEHEILEISNKGVSL